MAYLTDKEKRLLFSALTREKKVCVEVDKECCREAYEDTLESVVKNLEKKFYYDRFEKEIRAKAIDEFAERMKRLDEEGEISVAGWNRIVDNIAEQMKAGATNENSIIDEFANALKGRLTDAIHQKDVESMTNLINDVAREVKAGGKNE